MRLATPLSPTLLALLASLAPAQAPPDGGWVGRRVITQYGAVLQDGKGGRDDEGRAKSLAIAGQDRNTFRIYRVEHVKGPWLWLAAEEGTARGWVKSEWVVPFDQAIDFYTARIKANPAASANYNSRGNVWKARGELDIAIADYGEAIRLDPKYALPYVGRGNAWRAKEEYDRAIADFGEAIRLDPKYANSYNSLAWLRATCPEEKYRDGRAAVENATRACELSGWKDANPIDTLAAARAEAGDFAGAIEAQEKAIALLPKNSELLAEMKERIALYREGKPYRDVPK